MAHFDKVDQKNFKALSHLHFENMNFENMFSGTRLDQFVCANKNFLWHSKNGDARLASYDSNSMIRAFLNSVQSAYIERTTEGRAFESGAVQRPQDAQSIDFD